MNRKENHEKETAHLRCGTIVVPEMLTAGNDVTTAIFKNVSIPMIRVSRAYTINTSTALQPRNQTPYTGTGSQLSNKYRLVLVFV